MFPPTYQRGGHEQNIPDLRNSLTASTFAVCAQYQSTTPFFPPSLRCGTTERFKAKFALLPVSKALPSPGKMWPGESLVSQGAFVLTSHS